VSLSIQILLPKNNSIETKYVFHCLLNEFLGYDYEIETTENVFDFILKVGDKKLVVKNHFFQSSNDSLYELDRIPKKIEEGTIKVDSVKYPVITLFGENNVTVETDDIVIHSDLIASTFYMLTRWEEFVIQERDTHNRFDVKHSLAYKFNFLNRPIVNEYVDLLEALLLSIGYKGSRKIRKYKVVPTHDVDTPYLWTSANKVVRSFAHSILKKPSWYEFSHKIQCLVKGKDPFDTHDYFMNLSEANGVKSNFFFLCGGLTKYDNRYDINSPRILNLLKHIQKRGHNIGIHPTYDSYNDPIMLANEIESLKLASGQEIKTGRHHYLRFSMPQTWRHWEQNEMDWDSTLSYAGEAGFRCGVCYSYPVFDIENRKQLHLKEKPLIVMEASIVQYEKLTPDQCLERVSKLKNQVKKHNGEFVFLWHNSSFAMDLWRGYEVVLESMYN